MEKKIFVVENKHKFDGDSFIDIEFQTMRITIDRARKIAKACHCNIGDIFNLGVNEMYKSMEKKNDFRHKVYKN